jgi:hypothetical protein
VDLTAPFLRARESSSSSPPPRRPRRNRKAHARRPGSNSDCRSVRRRLTHAGENRRSESPRNVTRLYRQHYIVMCSAFMPPARFEPALRENRVAKRPGTKHGIEYPSRDDGSSPNCGVAAPGRTHGPCRKVMYLCREADEYRALAEAHRRANAARPGPGAGSRLGVAGCPGANPRPRGANGDARSAAALLGGDRRSASW